MANQVRHDAIQLLEMAGTTPYIYIVTKKQNVNKNFKFKKNFFSEIFKCHDLTYRNFIFAKHSKRSRS